MKMQEKMALDAKRDENLHGLAQTAKIIGDKHMLRGETELARRAFLSAIDFTCGIVQGTEKNCAEISWYLKLAAKTYPKSADQRILILTANRLYAHDINVNNLYDYLASLIDPSSGIDKNLLSDVLFPVLKFIYSNYPNFQNPYLRTLVDGFLTYFTDGQNNRLLFGLLQLQCERSHDYNYTMTALEHAILIKQEEIERLTRGCTEQHRKLKAKLKELEREIEDQRMVMKLHWKKIKKLQQESEMTTPARVAEEIEKEIEEIIAQRQQELEINTPAKAAKMSSPELHRVVNNFHAYRIDHQDNPQLHQDNPQLLNRLSSNFTWLLENLDRIMTLEHELIELQERIERLTEHLTKCKIIGTLKDLEKKEAIRKSQKLFIKELEGKIEEIKQLQKESEINETVVAASEQLLEVTERLPLPRAASEQPLEITEQLPLLRATRLPRAERAASEPPSSSFKRKEREPSPSFFGLRALEKKEATPDEPQLKRMRIRDDRTPTPFSLPAPLSL